MAPLCFAASAPTLTQQRPTLNRKDESWKLLRVRISMQNSKTCSVFALDEHAVRAGPEQSHSSTQNKSQYFTARMADWKGDVKEDAGTA